MAKYCKSLKFSTSGETYNLLDAEQKSRLDNLEPTVAGKQDTLISGTNIKTINGNSILGSGNITIEGSGGGAVDSVNGKTGAVVLNASDVGAQTVISDSNKLNADFIQNGTTNKTVTASEKSTWNAKANAATTIAGYGITDAYTKTEVNTALGGKANSATTLAGYGITDAYTKTEVNNLISNTIVEVSDNSTIVQPLNIPS